MKCEICAPEKHNPDCETIPRNSGPSNIIQLIREPTLSGFILNLMHPTVMTNCSCKMLSSLLVRAFISEEAVNCLF